MKRPIPVKPGSGQESVWDYPRPPRVERVTRRVRVELAGLVIADTTRALRVCETAGPPSYYIPPGDIRMDLLQPGPRSSYCEWKGTASHWTARVGPRIVEDAAWSYPDPSPGYEAIRDHLAFYAGKMGACSVGGDPVTPQPGPFYGGWITPDIVGPFKGEPGSEGW